MVDEWQMKKEERKRNDNDEWNEWSDDDDEMEERKLDEWLAKEVDDMKKCVKLMEGNVLWIVLSRSIIKEEWYEDFMKEAKIKFRFPELNYTFRNAKEIIEEVKLIMKNKNEHPQLPPSRFPSSEKPLTLAIKYGDLNDETKTNEILQEIKLNVTEDQINGLLIITGLVTEEHSLKCLVNCVRHTFKDSYGYFVRFKHLSYNKIEDFLANGKGVCVCDSYAAEGFEAPIVVVYGDGGNYGGDYNTFARHNLYLRAIQKLIVIEIEF